MFFKLPFNNNIKSQKAAGSIPVAFAYGKGDKGTVSNVSLALVHWELSSAHIHLLLKYGYVQTRGRFSCLSPFSNLHFIDPVNGEPGKP